MSNFTTECPRCGGGTGQAKACDCAVTALKSKPIYQISNINDNTVFVEVSKEMYDAWYVSPKQVLYTEPQLDYKDWRIKHLASEPRPDGTRLIGFVFEQEDHDKFDLGDVSGALKYALGVE